MTVTPEMIEAGARAIQIANRPLNDCRNDDQRAADESDTLGAYKALAEVGYEAMRALDPEVEVLRLEASRFAEAARHRNALSDQLLAADEYEARVKTALAAIDADADCIVFYSDSEYARETAQRIRDKIAALASIPEDGEVA